MTSSPSRAFTLIELLLVIGIVAILSLVVVLVLNPAEILRQSRDAGRLSDMETLNKAIGLYQASVQNSSLGSASTTYVSIPDPTATTTAGDACQGISNGLPAIPTGWTYHCAASSSYRNVDGTGWIPVNFTQFSSQSPLNILNIDPVNQTSTSQYYTYVTNGSTYQLTAHFESQKYLPLELASGGYDLALYKTGSNINLAPFAGGLVGYYPFDEGSGSVLNEFSGNNASGTWSGPASGTGGTYYVNGKVGPYAGFFDGVNSSTYNTIRTASVTLANPIVTMTAWINVPNNNGSNCKTMVGRDYRYTLGLLYQNPNLHSEFFYMSPTGTVFTAIGSTVIGLNQWIFFAQSVDQNENGYTYLNGQLDLAFKIGTILPTPAFSWIGTDDFPCAFNGEIDDLRIYNRVLSSGEIQAIYNAQK